MADTEDLVLSQQCIPHLKGHSTGMQAISEAYDVILPLRFLTHAPGLHAPTVFTFKFCSMGYASYKRPIKSYIDELLG